MRSAPAEAHVRGSGGSDSADRGEGAGFRATKAIAATGTTRSRHRTGSEIERDVMTVT